MEELIFELLQKKNLIKDNEKIAYNEVNIEEDAVIIKGNKVGLIQLADYLVQIAISDKEYCHVHLDNSNFFDRANCEIIIVKNVEKKTP